MLLGQSGGKWERIEQNKINRIKEINVRIKKNERKGGYKRQESMYKKKWKKFLRKGINFQYVMDVGAMFIDLLKNRNMQRSKACKIEMLKKQNNNSIFLKFY